jgi:hypothetical protein
MSTDHAIATRPVSTRPISTRPGPIESTPRRHRAARSRPAGSAPLAALLALVALVATGCWSSPGPEPIRRAVERQVPGARFDREVHVRLGRMTTGLARWIANRALDDEDDAEAKVMINAVRRVEVAVYTNRSRLAEDSVEAVTMPPALRKMLGRQGWAVMAEARDPGSTAWVLVDQSVERGAAAIRGIYVVSLDADELAIVRLEGRFDEAFAKIFADDPYGAPEHALDDTETVEG